MKLNEVLILENLSDKDYATLENLLERMICSDLHCSDSQKEHAVMMLARSAGGSKKKAMSTLKSMVKKDHPKASLFDSEEFEVAFDNVLANMTGGTEFEWLKESHNQKIYLKVNDPNKQTGMPSGWNLVQNITKEDDKFYVETNRKGYGVFFNKDKNQHKLRLGSQSGQPITITSAYEIMSGKK